MPLESSVKGIAFYINLDGEYKELGEAKSIQTIQNFGVAAEEASKKLQEIAKLFGNSFEAEVSIPVQFKKYKRKRFKKLLMARGIQRNKADLYSRTLPRTDFSLIKLSESEV